MALPVMRIAGGVGAGSPSLERSCLAVCSWLSIQRRWQFRQTVSSRSRFSNGMITAAMSARHSGHRVRVRGADGCSIAVIQISLAFRSGIIRRNWLKFRDCPPQPLHRNRPPSRLSRPWKPRRKRR